MVFLRCDLFCHLEVLVSWMGCYGTTLFLTGGFTKVWDCLFFRHLEKSPGCDWLDEVMAG